MQSVVDEMVCKISIFKQLQRFEFLDADKRDQVSTTILRSLNLSLHIVSFSERERAKAWKNYFQGFMPKALTAPEFDGFNVSQEFHP
jgi:hypothetical protein